MGRDTQGPGGKLASGQASIKDGSSTEDLIRLAADLALQKKGEDVVILDLRAFPIGCDFFIIVSAKSNPHARAIAEWIEDELIDHKGVRPWHREGLAYGHWILLDYVDWVVHVFHEEARQYYMLERLWGDAPRERLDGGIPVGDAAAGEDEGIGGEE